MDELGLEITKVYHDLYSFDSKRVKCLGVIKDLLVFLSHLPMKSIVMDIVVADISLKFGMLLSISFMKRLGGTCRWICHMPQFQFLKESTRDYRGKFS